jgi:S-formylglutathione hydrolase FrmB
MVCMAAAVAGCALPGPTVRPLVQVTDPAPCAADAARPRALLVLMPGRGMALSELQERGFVRAVRERGFDVDVSLVDTHLGYWQERSVFHALREDIIAPARQRGVTQIWLAGISLGGYGALLYDARYPGEVAGAVAIAPYLGLQEVVDAVSAAGGVRPWTSPLLGPFDESATPVDTDRHLWRWLQRQTGPAGPGTSTAPPLPIHLAFGDSDRFVKAQRLLAAALPPERVVVTPGGHDWPAWQPAWGTLLDRMPWPRRAACVRRD